MGSFLDRFNPTIQKKEVMLLYPDDHRYVDLTVDHETEGVVFCNPYEGVFYRFFRLGPGWSGKAVRFLAVIGQPLISYISGKDPDDSTKDLIATCGFEEYLRIIWKDKGYDGLPKALKAIVRLNTVGTTVAIKPYIPGEELQDIFDEVKAESVLYDSDLENLANLGKSVEVKKWSDKVFDKIPWIMTGFGLNYILVAMGIL